MGRGPSIEGRKNAEDAKRAKVFTKLIREITVATRAGVADPAGNPRLRAAVDKALSANMTRDTIERAIEGGSGTDGGADMEELGYEGYGPAGIALIIDCSTDNQASVEEFLLDAALEAGADDVINENGESSVLCAPENFEAVQQALIDAGLQADHAGVVMRPNNRVEVPEEALEPLRDLLDRLDALDDVSEVSHNALLPS